jgi:hypothetical protein
MRLDTWDSEHGSLLNAPQHPEVMTVFSHQQMKTILVKTTIVSMELVYFPDVLDVL